ncbi:MAG: hypothetical protein ACOY4K_09780 [Pseudomonadota bacterium]
MRKLIATTILAAAFAAGALAGAAIADQPKMHSALDHLRAARADLQDATRDKGGHRDRALTATNNAIAQVEAGIRFDRRH